MNNAEMIKEIAVKTGFTQKDTKTVIDAMKEVVYGTLADGDEIKVFDGLTITTVSKDARVCRNPRTGETINVPAKRMPKARFGKHLKDAVL